MYYYFDNYLIDKENRKLFCDGELLSDDEKTITLLAMLCENYPEVVDKQLLLETLWPEQVVTDWSLSKLVSDVRQLLGDTGKNQSLIKTIRGKGFRINAEVTKKHDFSQQSIIDRHSKQTSTKNTAASQKTLWLSISALIMLSTSLVIIYTGSFSQSTEANQKYPLRVAVMPVMSNNNSPINEWLKYGIMSMASEQLARYDAIQTLPVATLINVVSGLYEDNETLPEDSQYYDLICGQIGCSHLVVLRYGTEENNSAVLSYQIYSKEYRSAISEFIQPDVLDAVDLLLGYLVSDLIPGEIVPLSLDDTFSKDSRANRDYAIGVHDLLSGDIKSAKIYLELALGRQPDFFWANAYLTEVYYRQGELSLAEKRISDLKSSNPPASGVYFLEHLRSNILYSQGKLKESLQVSITLQENPYAINDPLLMGNELLNIGSSYQAKGELIKATNYLNRAQESYQQANYAPGEGKALFNIANVLLSDSKLKQSIEYYQKALEIFIRFDMKGYALMAKHQIATTSTYLGKLKFAESELRLIINTYKELGDKGGELTAELDMVAVSIAKSDFVEASNRIESLINIIQNSEFSYLNNLARNLAVSIYLRLGKLSVADEHYNSIEGQWQDSRPGFAFIAAHLLQAKGQLQAGLNAAHQVKTSLGAQWTESHQKVLDQFTASVEQDKILPIIY